MAFEVRLDPDDGSPPAVLGFEEYRALFPALVAVSPSFLAPLKRFRGAHARFDLPAEAVPAVLQELAALRDAAPAEGRFLDDLAAVARKALAKRVGLRGRSP
jgi:hypothetical protein